MSTDEEDKIGKKEHKKVLEQFGGEYKNVKLNNYINSLGKFLVSTSELPEKEFKFTILNTPIINAFALPGGYIYLTRGLYIYAKTKLNLQELLPMKLAISPQDTRPKDILKQLEQMYYFKF